MTTRFSSLLHKLKYNPRLVFQADGIGAAVSALLLGLVLPRFQSIIGMPVATLYLLAAIPVLFMIYDVLCAAWVKKNWRVYIKGIAYANLGYCLFSAGAVIYHWPLLKPLGVTYFAGEILLVTGLVSIELKVARALQKD